MTDERSKSGSNRPRLVVGLGASAGGLDALRRFLAHLPADSGLAVVVVQHLDPDHATKMPEILRRVAPVPVEEVEDGALLEADRVVIIPPNRTLTVDSDRLRLTEPTDRRGRRRPVDRFFISLAHERGAEAVCVVLSGTGSDGTVGLKAVKEGGGMTLAQAPESSLYDGMPRNALATGLVDHVLAPEEMPERILTYAEHLQVLRAEPGLEALRREVELRVPEITSLLEEHTGYDFLGYRRTTLGRRIQRRIQVTRATSVDDYLETLRGDREEAASLLQDLLIGVTRFFRDPEAFAALAAGPIRTLLEEGSGPIRAWVPACATGEEAYTLAMLLTEAVEAAERPRSIQVFATDIDVEALELARTGIYPRRVAEHVTAERLARFFEPREDGYRVAGGIRDLCIFSVHNLIANPPLHRVDLLSCRNLLIYFEADLQREVIELFRHALAPGGFLFLGRAETAPGESEGFETVDSRHRIYRRPAAASPRPLRLPSLAFDGLAMLGVPRPSPGSSGASPGTGEPPAETATEGGRRTVDDLERQLEVTREDLRSTVEELETANEELQASNEELLSMNEELHSSNEELEISREALEVGNEELEALNAELERKVEELARARDEARRLAVMVESSHDAILGVGRDGRLRTWNRGAAGMCGWSAEEMVGEPVERLWPPGQGQEVRDLLHRTLLGEPLGPLETPWRRSDGSQVPVAVSFSPIRDEEERVVGASLIARDLTELQRLQEELRRRLDELAAADRRKDEFLAMLAHELRNPLAPLVNGLALLRGEPPAGRKGALLDLMERQASQLGRLVDDLLDVSRITRGKIELRKKPLDLRRVVRAAVETSTPDVGGRAGRLELELPDDPVPARGDAVRLQQVVQNLLHNAAKYSDPHEPITLALGTDDRRAVLRVTDRGIGMSQDVLERAFELFAQGEQSLARSEGGLGVGLTTVQRLVELHGGSVEAASDGPGTGSTFTVRLPLTDPSELEAHAPDPSRSAGDRSTAGKRVLIVEDNLDAAEALAELVGTWGHETRVAYDGPSGVEAAEQFRPQVILVDIGLPGMDGFEVAEAVRANEDGGEALLVALTGYGHRGVAERAVESGFDHHVLKPTDPAELRRLIAGAESSE